VEFEGLYIVRYKSETYSSICMYIKISAF